MAVVKTCRMIVGETRDDVLEAAQRTYEVRRKAREAQIEQPGPSARADDHVRGVRQA